MAARFPYSPAQAPPIPAVVLDLVSPDGSQVVLDVPGHLDTAADCTIVPLPLVHRLGLQPFQQVTAYGFGSAGQTLGVYHLRLAIPGVGDVPVDAVGHSHEQYILVGRDVLNRFRVTFDGPNRVVEFH